MTPATAPLRGDAAGIGSWYRSQVRPRLTAELVFSGVALRGTGRERRAACPLHGGDNREALAVNVHDLRWHCLTGCDGGGDALAWLAARNGLARPGESPRGAAFYEAVRIAAGLVGMAPPGASPLPEEERQRAAERLEQLDAVRARAAEAEAAELTAKVAAARALWAAAEPDSLILSGYLARRRSWPPRDAAERCGLPSTPPRARYASREAVAAVTAPLTERGTGWQLPHEASGAVVYAYAPTNQQQLAALQLDALTAAGRHPRRRWRRGLGSRRGGAVFRVRGRAGPDGWTAICEGEVTALALAAAEPGVYDARAVGGAEGLTPEAAAGAGRVWIVRDADAPNRRGVRPGPRAAIELARQLVDAGVVVRESPAAGVGGADYADALAAHIAARETALRADGLNDAAALSAAWLATARRDRCALCDARLSGEPFCSACGASASAADQAAIFVEAGGSRA